LAGLTKQVADGGVMEMKIYKISQDENCGYDTYDSAVVIALDEDHARNINPSGGKLMTKKDWDYEFSAWARKPENVKVELIGSASSCEVDAGVICASFNAG
jgi:hypothetical protein